MLRERAMSISSGGRAAKLGNRYEGLWVAYQLLRLLWEEISAVNLEEVGDEECGVDVWVTNRDGSRHAYQCKRKNRATGKWSITDLVIVCEKAAEQLRRDRSALFTFVSSDPAPELRELAEMARAVGGDAEKYSQLTLDVPAHAASLRRFWKAVGVSELDPAGRQDAFDLLVRMHTHGFDDGLDGRAQVALYARCLVLGDPRTVIEVLADYAQEHMGTALNVDHVRQHLRDRGFSMVHLVGDPRVAGRIEQLRHEFRELLLPSLIQSSLVSRPEAVTIFEMLTTRGTPPLVVLHGKAGGGKSCVLLQLTELLDQAGIPFLPLRLDRRPPRTSSRQYGIDCGLPESPAVILHSLHPGRRVVLIVDQLDAIRWTSSHASASWEACQEMLGDALRLPNVAVVVACRTFDLRDDQQLSAWQGKRHGEEVEAGNLPEESVAAAVDAAGSKYAELTPRQQDLLRTPLHLALWVQVRRGSSKLGEWNTQADLLRAFWKSRFDAATELKVPLAEIRSAVETLVTYLDERGVRAAPARILDIYGEASRALKSLHVVVEAEREISFTHQSYFEFRLATQLIDRIHAEEGALANWVRSGEQSLLRREQLRLVLTLLRDEDPDEYLVTIRAIMLSPSDNVRFHLRLLVLRLIGETPHPTGPECDLVCELARIPSCLEHVFDQVFVQQPIWFGEMDDRGLLSDWLSSADKGEFASGLQFCRLMSHCNGDRLVRLISQFLQEADPWPTRVASMLPYDPNADSDGLFRIRLQLIRRGITRHPRLIAKELSKQKPARIIDIFEAYLDHNQSEPEAAEPADSSERDFPHFVPHHEVEYLKTAAESLPRDFWMRLAPLVTNVCERTREVDESQRRPWPPFFHDTTWNHHIRSFGHQGHTELPVIVAFAGAKWVTQDPILFAHENSAYMNHPSLTIQYMVGLAFAGAGESAADMAIGWLCDNPHRLSLTDEHARSWGIAQRILAVHARACSLGVFERLERTILDYHEPSERRSVEWQLTCLREQGVIFANEWGLAQHALLPCLPEDRMGNSARSEMGVLACKFPRPASSYAPMTTGRSSYLTGPIQPQRVPRLTDHAWLQIIAGPAGNGTPRQYIGDRIIDTSVEGFARLLGERARLEPQRFAALFLGIPLEANPAYLTELLRGLSITEPPNANCPDWLPAPEQLLTAIIEYVGYVEDREIAESSCWLMHQRPLAVTTPQCVNILSQYATAHPHPAPDWKMPSANSGDHETESLNCTRGGAIGAISSVLFAQPSLFDAFLPTLRHTASDPHPAVRLRLVEACMPILNVDRNVAVELFLAACENQEAMLAARRVWEFTRYAQWSHYESLEHLLLRMARSTIPAAATAGAAWLTLGWLTGKSASEAVDECSAGTTAQRIGVAMAAAHNSGEQELIEKCGDLLRVLIVDPDSGVREQASEFLRQEHVLRAACMRDMARQFVGIPEFGKHSYWLVEAIRNHPETLVSLTPVFEAVCGRLPIMLGHERDQATQGGNDQGDSFDINGFVPLILRLYEQAEQVKNTPLRDTCLDWLDRLLEARLGGAMQVLGDLEAGRTTPPF